MAMHAWIYWVHWLFTDWYFYMAVILNNDILLNWIFIFPNIQISIVIKDIYFLSWSGPKHFKISKYFFPYNLMLK